MGVDRIDFGVKFRSARDALFALLYDLKWHSFKELCAVVGLRYGARLLELKRLGYVIESSELETGKMYRLVSLEVSQPKQRQVRVYLTEAECESIIGATWSGFPDHGAIAKVRRALHSFRASRGRL